MYWSFCEIFLFKFSPKDLGASGASAGDGTLSRRVDCGLDDPEASGPRADLPLITSLNDRAFLIGFFVLPREKLRLASSREPPALCSSRPPCDLDFLPPVDGPAEEPDFDCRLELSLLFRPDFLLPRKPLLIAAFPGCPDLFTTHESAVSGSRCVFRFKPLWAASLLVNYHAPLALTMIVKARQARELRVVEMVVAIAARFG